MAKVACVASVSVRFRRKGRGTRVKDRAKNGFLALVSFLARSKPKVSFLGISLLRNQTETLAQAMAKVFVRFTDICNHAPTWYVSVASMIIVFTSSDCIMNEAGTTFETTYF